jgi:hypothetical protein
VGPAPAAPGVLTTGPLRLTVVAAGAGAALAPHVDAWTALGDEAEEPNVFWSPWLLRPALDAFAGDERGPRQVEVLLFHAPHPTHKLRPEVLVGVCALEHRRARLVPLPTTRSFRHPAIHLGTPIVRPGFARAVADRLLDHLGDRRRVVTLQEIRGDGPFHDALIDALNARGWGHVGLLRSTRALLLPDPGGADAYLDRALAGKRRKELRRQRDRLAEQVGALAVETLAAGDDARPWLEQYLTLEAAGWKGHQGGALAARPDTRRFFTEAMTGAHQQGRLHMMRLTGARAAGPLAVKCNLIAGVGAFAFKITFDERQARFSPGVQLELENIRWFHQQAAAGRLRWMDSCAHHTRFMINHLWTARRPVEWLAFSTGHTSSDLLVALLPTLAWARRQLARRRDQHDPGEGRRE